MSMKNSNDTIGNRTRDLPGYVERNTQLGLFQMFGDLSIDLHV